MAEVDHSLLLDTLDRVKEALNCRFEKEAELYISQQEVQKIKELLSKNKFQGIFGLYTTQNHSADILTKVILDNAWLITSPKKKDLKRYLKSIFNECSWELFSEYMSDVLDDKKEISLVLKKMLVDLYYKNAPLNISEERLEKGYHNLEIINICFERVLNSLSTAEELYKKSKTYLTKYPQLKNSNVFILRNSRAFKSLADEEKIKILDIILEEEIIQRDKPEKIWILLFCDFQRFAFERTINFLNDFTGNYTKELNKKISKAIISRLINKDDDNRDYYIQTLLNLYTKRDDMRFSLIMNCFDINNKTSKEIVNSFVKIGVPNGAEKQIDIILNRGNKEEKKTLDSSREVYEKIINDPSGSKLKPRKNYLEWIVYMLNDSSKSEETLENLLKDYGDQEVVQRFVTLFLKMKGNNKRRSIVLNYYYNQSNQDGNLKEKLLQLSKDDEDFKNNKEVKEFVYNVDFDLYRRLYGHSSIG